MQKQNTPLIKRPIVRIFVIWLIEAIALVLMTYLFDGLYVDSFRTALAAAALIGLLNALLWPILSYLILPFAVLTLGFAALLMNGLIIMLASVIIQDNFYISNIWTAIGVAFGLTAINAIFSALLTIDDDNSYYRNVVKRRAKRLAKPIQTDVPGIFFLEIDGLAEPVLEKALREGYAPTMKRWLEEGTHKVISWETDLSSQTSASQLGILHGSNHNIPAFRWYDRQRKEIIASSNPDELVRLEKEHSNGDGLLVDGGASRGNLMSGDAPIVSVTASTMKDLSRLHMLDFYAYFVNPYNITRTILLMIWDIILEKRQFRKARKEDLKPRLDKHHRGGKYPLLRVFTTIIMRELNIYTLIGDMYAGVPSAYATFVGYDEVAHHSGVETHDALDVLRKLDEQFARLENAAKDAPRPYKFVILSDHGQSGGETFLQRYGLSLQDLIQQLAKEFRVQAIMNTNESWGHVNVFLTDAITHDKKSGGMIQRAVKDSMVDGDVALGPDKHEPDEIEVGANIIVLASGNLGLVYSTAVAERVMLEEVEALFPGLLDGLVQHEGIGWVMMHSSEHGPVVLGSNGRYYLEADRIEGQNPLAGFGDNARQHLLRYDKFPDAPDMYVNSFYNAETNEVAAFEELIGCHGGMGGYQTQPFVMYPSEWKLDSDELIGAAAVYHQFKSWLAQEQKSK